MKKRLLFSMSLLSAICLTTCTPKVALKGSAEKLENYLLPVSSVEVAPGLFYDKRETMVIDWREYLYWLKDVYGIKSDEFKAALPSTSVWGTPYRCLAPLENDYFSLVKYSTFPMVGISRVQALAYAKWRADRLMEVYLLTMGAITHHYDPGPRNHFTIERYLSGKYRRFKPHPDITRYIHYRLPSEEDWEKAQAHNEKVLRSYLEQCQEDCQEPVNAGQNPCVLEEAITLPVVKTTSGMVPDSLNYIRHLKGNVAEWSATPGVTLGGSWFHTPADVAQYALFRADTPNAWTGFRLVAEYREVGY
jgi:hypothetical protein